MVEGDTDTLLISSAENVHIFLGVCCQKVLDSSALPYDDLLWLAKNGLYDAVEALMSRGCVEETILLMYQRVDRK